MKRRDKGRTERAEREYGWTRYVPVCGWGFLYWVFCTRRHIYTLRTRHTTRSFLALRVYRLAAPALLFIAAMYRSAADICAPPPGGDACEPPAPGGPTLCAGILALAARSAAESGGLLGPAPGFAGPAPLALAIAPGAVGFGLLAPPKLAGIAPAPLEPLLFLLCCPASSAPFANDAGWPACARAFIDAMYRSAAVICGGDVVDP